LQESRQKTSLLSWAATLVALVLGLAVVCLTGAALAMLVGLDGSGANNRVQPTAASMAVGTPTIGGAEMGASSEQGAVETYGGIPLPEGVSRQQVVGSEQDFSIIIQQPFDRVVAFYQAVMPEREWMLTSPDIGPGGLADAQTGELCYEKDGIVVVVSITQMPFVGTIVAVTFG